MNKDLPRTRELLLHLEDSDLTRSLVQLLFEGTQAHRIAGSGTLLKIAGIHFLVTASHVVDACRDGIRVPSISERKLISCGFEGILGSTEGTLRPSYDKHDVAVLRISDDFAARLIADGRRFLSTAHVETMPPSVLSTGRCLVLGYPAECTTHEDGRVNYTPQVFACEPADPANGDSLSASYDPKHHFLFTCRKTSVNARNGEEERTVHPRGMSGGSVWWLGDESELAEPAISAEKVRWIGVQSAYFEPQRDEPHGFLKAVSLNTAYNLIVKQWPDLEPALSIARFSAVPRKPWQTSTDDA